MTFRRRQRWLRRLALGFAFGAIAVAGSMSSARAEPEDTALGWSYASAGGWSGAVDSDSGIPLSAGIPDSVQLAIPGEPADPYLTDVFVRQGESKGGPDGDEIAFANAIESRAAAQARAKANPYSSDGFVDDFPRPGESQGGPDGSARQ
jgi:hypothetical protein